MPSSKTQKWMGIVGIGLAGIAAAKITGPLTLLPEIYAEEIATTVSGNPRQRRRRNRRSKDDTKGEPASRYTFHRYARLPAIRPSDRIILVQYSFEPPVHPWYHHKYCYQCFFYPYANLIHQSNQTAPPPAAQEPEEAEQVEETPEEREHREEVEKRAKFDTLYKELVKLQRWTIENKKRVSSLCFCSSWRVHDG